MQDIEKCVEELKKKTEGNKRKGRCLDLRLEGWWRCLKDVVARTGA